MGLSLYNAYRWRQNLAYKGRRLLSVIKNPRILTTRQKLGLGTVGIAAFLVAPAAAVGLYGQINEDTNATNNINAGQAIPVLKQSSTFGENQASAAQANNQAQPSDDSETLEDGISTHGTASNSSSVNVRVESRSSSSTSDPDDSNQFSGNVIVNGQSIDLPANGTINKRVKNSDGTTNLRLRVYNTSRVDD